MNNLENKYFTPDIEDIRRNTRVINMKNKLKIYHFSDTHTFHRQLNPPECDIAIFSGDCSNPRDTAINNNQVRDFIEWYGSLNIKHKIFVAGNHDVSIERRAVTPADFFVNGIIYLENTSTTIEDLKIWGSPYTPSFGVGWAFNRDRGKIDKVWDLIPEDTDIVVIHGPIKGVLDLSYNRDGELEFCGCAALRRKIFTIKPKLFCSGHIHSMEKIQNSGIFYNNSTYFSNGTCVEDGKFDKGIVYNGNIFEYYNNKITIHNY